jgi:hypothetical protein
MTELNKRSPELQPVTVPAFVVNEYNQLKLENIALKEQLRWRPVSEGLPEIGQRVLYLGNNIDIGEYNGYGEWIDTDGGVLPIQRTTHWLPIPPAPDTLPDGWEVT